MSKGIVDKLIIIAGKNALSTSNQDIVKLTKAVKYLSFHMVDIKGTLNLKKADKEYIDELLKEAEGIFTD